MKPINSTIALLATALLTGAFAGCVLEPGKLEAYHVLATKGSFAAGFAYDGKGVQTFDGSAFLDINDVANTGLFVAKGKVGAMPLEVAFESFAQSKPFHDGGIAADFMEHGASGVGDTSIPAVDLEMAGWGTAAVKLNNQLYKDPLTGMDAWTAHFMVIKNGVRDNTTGAIYADMNKSKPYDPKMPGEGYSVAGDYEVHLVLRNQTVNGTVPGPVAVGPVSYTQTSAMVNNQNVKLFTGNVLGSSATLTINVTGNPNTLGQNFTFTFKAPSGKTVATRALGGNQQNQAPARLTTQIQFMTDEIGDYTVSVTGRNSQNGGYNIQGALITPPSVVMNLWWEELEFGDSAEAKAMDLGLLEGSHEHPTASPSATASPTTVPARRP